MLLGELMTVGRSKTQPVLSKATKPPPSSTNFPWDHPKLGVFFFSLALVGPGHRNLTCSKLDYGPNQHQKAEKSIRFGQVHQHGLPESNFKGMAGEPPIQLVGFDWTCCIYVYIHNLICICIHIFLPAVGLGGLGGSASPLESRRKVSSRPGRITNCSMPSKPRCSAKTRLTPRKEGMRGPLERCCQT